MPKKSNDQIKKFLQAISMNESSGGKNLEHKTMQTGIHEGDTAIGQYGLMPNTVQEMHRRMQLAGRKDYSPDIVSAESKQIEDLLKSNPALQQQAAEYMAENLIKKTGGDLEAAAYGWRYGHNLPSDRLIEESIENPYVESFNKYYRDLSSVPVNNFSNVKNKLRGK